MIIDIANYRWRSPAFHAWVRQHGVDMKEVLRIHVNEYIADDDSVRIRSLCGGLPAYHYSTMRAAEKIREIKLMSPVPN